MNSPDRTVSRLPLSYLCNTSELPGDHYLLYICSNHRDYNYAFNRARADHPMMPDSTIEDQLCNNKAFADQYNFPASIYFKNLDGQIIDETDAGLGFDVDSVMMYKSEDISNPLCLSDPDYCALRKWQRTPTGGIAYLRPPLKLENTWPSDGDARWVKKYYPAT
jgi:hypothetical protein